MNALLIDAGNSRVKWARWDGQALSAIRSAATAELRASALETLTGSLPNDVSRILVSNVAGPELRQQLAERLPAATGADVEFAVAEARRDGLVSAYSEPGRMGVDRWLAMLGAWSRLREACLVVDVGTAMTIDVIDDEGRHLGGQIVPGLELMLSSLHRGTGELPNLRGEDAVQAGAKVDFGADTESAMRIGARSALIGAVLVSVERVHERLPAARLVLTGGGAPLILDVMTAPCLHHPDLVLQGLARWLETSA